MQFESQFPQEESGAISAGFGGDVDRASRLCKDHH